MLSHFEYLNRSNRPEADRVRRLVDDFLSRYPAVNRTHLRKRLRSVDDVAHLGAFFELALHEILLRAGCRVAAVEPSVEGTRKVPDFLVETPWGERFYAEATLATGRSRADVAAQRRLDQAFKTIDSTPSPDFFLSVFLSVSISGTPAAMITGKKLRRQLQRWLASLDYDEVTTAWEGDSKAVPVFVYEEHSVRFRISPVPRRKSRRSAGPKRSIGGHIFEARWVQVRLDIRNAIVSKATRYGALDLPYLVAVNATSDYSEEEDTVDALFGSPAMIVRWSEAGFEDEPTRLPDGAWRGRRGPINTRVSAVLSIGRLTPWSVGQRQARLVVNPWARKPFPDVSLGVDVLCLEAPMLRRVAGKDLCTLFGLPVGWPGS